MIQIGNEGSEQQYSGVRIEKWNIVSNIVFLCL